MSRQHLSSLGVTSLITGLLLAVTGAPGAALPADAFPDFESYVKISGSAASISGNDAAFQQRLRQPRNGGGGIEALHYLRELPRDVTFVIDGRALFGAEDYLGKFRLAKNEVGAFEVGYKRFRTFYDGAGGFFPLNRQWTALTPETLHVDRGEFWALAKFNRPNLPELELKYTDGFRRGQKDNTVWGDTDLTGLPFALAPNPLSPVRKLVPSYRDLDETHRTLEGSLKHVLGKTTLQLSLVSEKTDDVDTRYGTRFPGEVIPWSIAKLATAAQPAAKAAVAPVNWNNQVRFSQTDGMQTDLFGATARTETRFSDKFSVQAGLNYQQLDSSFTGDRPLYTSTPTAVGVVIVPTNNYLNLAGCSAVTVRVGTIGFDWKPAKDVFVKLALRGEDKQTQSSGSLTAVTATVNTTTGAITPVNSNQVFNSQVTERSLTPAVDLRYSGFKNLALYATASVRRVSGDERYVTPYNPVTTPVIPNGNMASNTMAEDRTKITVGANWQAANFLTLRGELFHKDNANKAVGYLARSDGFFDNYDLGYRYNGVKLTAVVKPAATLACTTRYVYQKGEATVTSIAVTGSSATGYAAAYPENDAMRMASHTMAETIDWNPTAQFYFQASATVVYHVIETVYPRAGVVAATATLRSWDASRVLQNANNNYVTASLLAGAVLTKADDLQFQLTYYRADNSNPELAPTTVPYGAGAKESLVTVGLKHKFSARCLGNLKLGYCDSQNETTGGNTNFRGPVGYFSLEYAL